MPWERRRTDEKTAEKKPPDQGGCTIGIFCFGAITFFHSLCRSEIYFSCNRKRRTGGMEFLFKCDGRAFAAYLHIRKTFLRICLCLRLSWGCCLRRVFLDMEKRLQEKEEARLFGENGCPAAKGKIRPSRITSSFLCDRRISQTSGKQFLGRVFHADIGEASGSCLQDRNYFAGVDSYWNVYPGTFFFVSSFVLWEPYSLLCRYCRERCLKEKGKIARKNAAYAKCAALHIWTLMVTRPGPVSVYAAMPVKPYAQEKTSIQENKYTIEKNS